MNEKTKTPAIPMTEVKSSQIHAIGHDPATNTLAIRFKNYKGDVTGLYHYSNFTAEQFDAFKNAESIGSHFGANIKRATEAHPFTRINESADDDAS